MQKLARSTFSATQKDALLDQFKAIVDAGEVTLRSDSFTIAQLERTYHLDSTEITRYTRAIESLNSRYGWHLDAQKTLSRLGKKLGKKCGGGWISPEKKCKSHYTDGKLNSSGKVSSADLADRIRSRKKMTAIRSRDGKMKNGQWDIGAAFAPGNEQQSSIRASRTGPNNNRTLNPDRAARMMAKEENRAYVNWGKTTGDWKQKPDSTAAMDMVKPKPIDAPKTDPKKPAMSDGTVVEKGQDVWLSGTWDGGSKQKRTVVSWSKDKKTVTLRPTTLNPDQARRVREERKNSIYDRKYPASVLHVSEESANKDIERAAIEEAAYKKRVYDMRVREMTAPTPIASAKPLKDLFSEADRIGAKYSGPSTMAERRIAKQEADRIMEESGATQAVGRAIGKVAMIDPARTPVRIPNQRRSNEPRRRGRSVD